MNSNSFVKQKVKYIIEKYSVIKLCGKGQYVSPALAKLNNENGKKIICDLNALRYFHLL